MFTLIQLLKLIVMSGDMDQCVTIVGHELLFFAFVDNELYFFDQNKYVCQRVRLKELENDDEPVYGIHTIESGHVYSGHS